LDKEDGTNKVIILGETNHTDLAQSGWTVPFALACSDGVFSGLLVANVAGSSAMFDDFDHFPTLPLGIQTRNRPDELSMEADDLFRRFGKSFRTRSWVKNHRCEHQKYLVLYG
jgi:hypothetical protein